MRPGFLFVTPGIKGTSTPAGEDQKRVLTPGRAVAAGSSLLVVGRAITGADDRQAAALEVLQDIAKAVGKV
jgi:orotidine-5'-phosphate decarboxylase